MTEAEKQVMLLEKKIALERETQAALDPEVGAAEVRAMEREIHRMRLRYAQLQRRQEQMISEMERQIYKRDNIEAKGKVAATRKGAPPTQAVLQKQLADLSKKLQSTTHDANSTHMAVLNLQEQQAKKGAESRLRRGATSPAGGRGARGAARRGAAGGRALRAAAHAVQARRAPAAGDRAVRADGEQDALRERIAEADDTARGCSPSSSSSRPSSRSLAPCCRAWCRRCPARVSARGARRRGGVGPCAAGGCGRVCACFRVPSRRRGVLVCGVRYVRV